MIQHVNSPPIRERGRQRTKPNTGSPASIGIAFAVKSRCSVRMRQSSVFQHVYMVIASPLLQQRPHICAHKHGERYESMQAERALRNVSKSDCLVSPVSPLPPPTVRPPAHCLVTLFAGDPESEGDVAVVRGPRVSGRETMNECSGRAGNEAAR